MNIIIRPALEADLSTLLEFEKGIIKVERPFDDTLGEGDIHYYNLLELIHSADAEVMVAKVDGKPVGAGYAKIKPTESFVKHRYFAHLGFMYVEPAFRGNAINQLVLNALTNWAKAKGITEARLEVYDENITAKKAYLKAGFKPSLLEMRMKI